MKSVLLLALVVCLVQANDEERLMSGLLASHGQTAQLVRPVENSSEVLAIELSFHPITIADYKPKSRRRMNHGILTVTGWLYQRWSDVHVGWDAEDYGGIEQLPIPYKMLNSRFWYPNLVPWDGMEIEEMQEVEGLAYSSGHVAHMPPVRMTLQCRPGADVNVTSCRAQFGTWCQTVDRVEIAPESSLNLQSMSAHPAWTVLGGEATAGTTTFDCCPRGYTSLTINLDLAHVPPPGCPHCNRAGHRGRDHNHAHDSHEDEGSHHEVELDDE